MSQEDRLIPCWGSSFVEPHSHVQPMTALRPMPRGSAWWVAGWHVILATFYAWRGVDGAAFPQPGWDWFWQTLPAEALRGDLWRSLLFLHDQPPLFNLLGGMAHAVAPDTPLRFLHGFYVLLGAAMSGMMVTVTHTLLGGQARPRTVLVIALLLAANPALLLFEAYPFYTLPSAFLVVAALWCLCRATRGATAAWRVRWSIAFVLALNLLILMRSLYHLVVLVPAIALVCVLAGERWRRVLVATLVVSLLSLGWYGKNAAIFGFFGGSSWLGLNLWKIATWTTSDEEEAELRGELREAARRGEVHPAVALVQDFEKPSRYRRFGFVDTSDVATLQRDDHHNLNIISIAALHQDEAVRYIRRNPLRYLRNVGIAYATFCAPSSVYKHLDRNARHLGWHEPAVSRVVLGQGLFDRLGWPMGSFWLVIIPLALGGYAIVLVRRFRARGTGWRATLAHESPMLATAALIGYTVAVSSLLDCGENLRFKFLVEQPMWVFVVALVWRLRTRGFEPGLDSSEGSVEISASAATNGGT